MHLQKIFLLFVISCISSEAEAGIIRTLTRLVQRIDSILRPRDNDVVSNPEPIMALVKPTPNSILPLQPQMVARHGYKLETHKVITKDGYILGMHRIPRGRQSNTSDSESRPVVYIQHGLTSSSADWLVSGPDKALGKKNMRKSNTLS